MPDTAKSALAKVRDLEKEDFDSDENLRLALTHLIQMIGEAARQVSAEFRVHHPAVPWNRIVGMRHKVVYDYLHVDYDIVWDVARHELPTLVVLLQRLTGTEDNQG